MQTSQKDRADLLANYVNNTNYDSLPEDAIDVKDAKKSMGTWKCGYELHRNDG